MEHLWKINGRFCCFCHFVPVWFIFFLDATPMAVAPRHRPRLVRRSRIPTLRWWPRLRGHHGAPQDIIVSHGFWKTPTEEPSPNFSKVISLWCLHGVVIFAHLWLVMPVILPCTAPENRCTVRFPILRLAMEVLVEAASEVPQGCFVTGIRKGHGVMESWTCHVNFTSDSTVGNSQYSQSLILHIDSYIIYQLFIVVLDRFDWVCSWMSYWNDWASLPDSGTIKLLDDLMLRSSHSGAWNVPVSSRQHFPRVPICPPFTDLRWACALETVWNSVALTLGGDGVWILVIHISIL